MFQNGFLKITMLKKKYIFKKYLIFLKKKMLKMIFLFEERGRRNKLVIGSAGDPPQKYRIKGVSKIHIGSRLRLDPT